jgi:hypothetical protein
MKTVLCCLIVLLLASLLTAQSAQSVTLPSNGTITSGLLTASPPSNEPVHNYQGEYILITRSWDSGSGGCYAAVPLSSGWTAQWSEGGYCGSASWKYDIHPYSNLADAQAVLMADCGGWNNNHYPCIYPANSTKSGGGTKEFVGIYKLERVLGADDVKFADGDTVKTHTVEEKEHWFQWTIDGQQAKK